MVIQNADGVVPPLPLATRVAAESSGGVICGIFLSTIYTPLELVKNRQQVAGGGGGREQSAWAIARHAYQAEGGLAKGLYNGHTLTMARSCVGNATMFGSYELSKGALGWLWGDASRPEVYMGSGVIAGWFSWFHQGSASIR